MGTHTKVSGMRDISTATALGRMLGETPTWANGFKTWRMATGFMCGATETATRGNGNTHCGMVAARTSSLMVTCTSGNMSMVKPVGRASTSGPTGITIKGYSKMA